MATWQTEKKTSTQSECRRCRSYCDKLIEPAQCIAMGCRFLYSYEEIATGRRFIGCLNKVFKGEIDLDSFLLAERAGGYGGIKMTGEALPQCQFTVEHAFEGDGPEFECVNRSFFDCDHGGADGIRAFDLRNALS
ncbi:MAG: hypothetical protein M3M99_07055 [Actinomycetota bacterium]|nr:hypothetical protein [Actinomycetota bacterium]